MENQFQPNTVTFAKGAYIFVEGQQNNGSFFIIQQGKVRISKEAVVEGDQVEILKPGDAIGVVSAMSYQSNIDTAQALTDLVLIRVQRNQYIGLIQSNAAVAMKIIKQFSGRLRHLNEALAKLTLHDNAGDDPSHLFNVGEYYFNKNEYALAFYAYAKYIKLCPQGNNVPLVKEKIVKLASMTKDLKTDFGGSELHRTYHKNAMIFAEGEPGNEIFIIQKGSVKITKIAENKESILAILRAGDIFGEMALLEDKPRLAGAVAYEDCNVMALNKANFEQMIHSQGQLVDKITTLLAERIWFIYKKLNNALISDPVGRVYDAMHIQLERKRIPLDGSLSPPSYTFDFGWNELLSIAGLSGEKNNPLLAKIRNNSKFQITDKSIHVASVMEIVRQNEYYRKTERAQRITQGIKK